MLMLWAFVQPCFKKDFLTNSARLKTCVMMIIAPSNFLLLTGFLTLSVFLHSYSVTVGSSDYHISKETISHNSLGNKCPCFSQKYLLRHLTTLLLSPLFTLFFRWRNRHHF